MTFCTGDTFVNQATVLVRSHLWAIISDTQQSIDKIVIVNVTSSPIDGDASCLLKSGEHPFIKHDTYVNYHEAKVVTLALLDELQAKGLITSHACLDCDVLARIRQGAMQSQFTKTAVRKVLDDQNLV